MRQRLARDGAEPDAVYNLRDGAVNRLALRLVEAFGVGVVLAGVARDGREARLTKHEVRVRPDGAADDWVDDARRALPERHVIARKPIGQPFVLRAEREPLEHFEFTLPRAQCLVGRRERFAASALRHIVQRGLHAVVSAFVALSVRAAACVKRESERPCAVGVATVGDGRRVAHVPRGGDLAAKRGDVVA